MLPYFLLFMSGASAGLLAGLFGVGGGIVLVPVLIFVLPSLGVQGLVLTHVAVATSLASIIFTGTSSAWRHHRQGAVDWSLVTRLFPGLALGALLGSWLSGFISAGGLRVFIAVVMLFVALRLCAGASVIARRYVLPDRWVLGCGGIIGAFSALCGIGGGSFTVPFLMTFGVPLRRAVAVSSACGVPLALLATVGYLCLSSYSAGLGVLSWGPVVWPAVLIIALSSVAFAQIGAVLAHRLPVQMLRRGFGLLLALMAVRLLI